MRRVSGMACALAMLAMVSVQAKTTTVTGTWTLTIESLPMRFVLAQKGSNVTGTLDYPHGAPFQLTGSFKKGTLTFSGGSESGRDNFTVRIDASGVLKEDGTLDGTLNAHFIDLNDAHEVVRMRDQQIKWTAVRTLRK